MISVTLASDPAVHKRRRAVSYEVKYFGPSTVRGLSTPHIHSELLDMMSHGKHSQPHGSGSLPRPPLRLVCTGKPSPRLCGGDAILKGGLWRKLGRMRRREATVRESVVRLIGGTKVVPTGRNLTIAISECDERHR